MSVQAGIWNFDGGPVNPRLLNDLSESLKQQGPDGESSYLNTNVAMLYRPFHTTTESRREKQPHFSRRGFVLTWDGRLDNRDDLIAEFRSYLEGNPTDVAIVAAAFDHWETDCFRRIIGDWALSIWKPEQQELTFATDYMAIRHIFYYLKQNRIWWATDLAPLVLLSGDKFHINDDYIAGYFAHEPDASLTPYREIREVPPGQFVRVRNGIAAAQRYWILNPTSRVRYSTDAEYEEHFRHLLRQSLRRRLRSDSSILAELSGGLDSSSIVCIADEILSREDSHTPSLDTLSYYDNTEPNADDWTYLRRIEEKRGRVGHHIDASKLGSSPAPLEYPEFSAVPGFLGSGRELETAHADIMRSGGYKVVLSGIGGDEFLGGVPDPTAQLADLIVQFKLISLAKHLGAWSLAKRKPWVQLLTQALADLLPVSLGQYVVRQARVEAWIDKGFAKRTRLAIRLLGVDEYFGFWLPTRRSYIAGVQLMANKLAKHQPSRQSLEETRYPYLDQNLLEFILSIPASQVLRPGERRSLMRRALEGIVPREILSRRTKQTGARTPILTVDKNLKQVQMAFESSLGCYLGYFSESRFLQSLQAARVGKGIHIVRMLRTISFEFWLRDLVARGLIEVTGLSLPSAAAEASVEIGA